MFTGIVEEVGTIAAVEQKSGEETLLRIEGPLVTSDAHLGDSIAVDGVCLTVVDLPGGGMFAVEAVPETLRLTVLGKAAVGRRVNLERALRADSRLGGHIVQGHVDGMGTVKSRLDGGRWEDFVFTVPRDLAPLIAHKGSITVSGVSLTVTSVSTDTFGVSLIPTTLLDTNLGDLAEGDAVNLEVDVLARYVARLMEGRVCESA